MSEVQSIALPNGTTIHYREAQHAYYAEYDEAKGKCSKRIPGFSTVAKALDTNADPLITWGAKLEAQGICELLEACPGDDERLALVGQGGDQLHRELIAAELDWRSVRDRRAQQGTTIHERVFAALARGEKPSLAHVADDERGWGQAAFRFWSDHNPDPVAVEQIVHSPTWNVAGRFDLLARINGSVILCDAKTQRKREDGRERYINIGHHAQLAGYAVAAVESGFSGPDEAWLVYLLDDGSYEVEHCASGPEDFEAALAAYDANKRIGKTARAQRKSAQKQLVAA